MKYIQQTKSLLEFNQVLDVIDSLFLSDYGRLIFKNQLENTQGFEEINIVKNYQQIAEFHFLKSQMIDIPIHSIYDFTHHTDKFHIENYFIDQESLLHLRNMVDNVRELKDFFKETNFQKELGELTRLTSTLFYDSAMIREINKIIDDEGEVKSSASKDLKMIRDRKATIYSSIDRAFISAMQQAKNNDYLHEIGESIRQGRRVLAIHAMNKRAMKGIILDESENGTIVYLEPAETIFLNNEASEMDREEQREIRRILIELTKFLSKYGKLIYQYQLFMAQWDIIRAKTRFMTMIGGTIPQISKQICLNRAFHPLLKIKNQKDKKIIVPFSLQMNSQEQMLMISGPNAGGKSVTLKTIGLIALMVKYAIPISAEGDSKMPIYQNIIGDLGDLQSISDELSTYSSKLTLWKYMLKVCDRDTLLLFDELGDGTDPSFGAAMSQVVLEKCLENQSTIIATTHYSDLKKFAENRVDTLNANMVFDEAKLEPLYQLSLGFPGSSYTFHIARKMGLNTELVKRAESLSKKEQIEYDKQLFRLEKKEKELLLQKQELERNDKELKKQMKDWNRLHLDLDLMRKKIKYEKMLVQQEQVLEKEREIQTFKEQLKKKRKEEELIEEQKKVEEEIKANKEKSNELFKQIHNVNQNQIIKSGDRVQFIQTNAVGIVEKISKAKATVIFDHIKSTIGLKDLLLLPPEEEKKKLNTKKIFQSEKIALRELDLRGKYVYEAIPELEDFINKALMNNYHEVKVIHGKGKLKTEILKSIQGFKSISKHTHPLPEHGGDGVTYIYF